MAGSEQRVIELKIECVDLPPHDWGGHSEIWLGIQCGKEVVQEVKLPIESAVFKADLRVTEDSAGTNPNFLGPYAHGTPQDRFVYLCWGRPYGGHWVGFRRVKLRLSRLNWDSLETNRLHIRVHCTDDKGGPVCAGTEFTVL